MIRLVESWRSLQARRSIQNHPGVARQQLGDQPAGREEGYAYTDFDYDGSRFRATAVGYPATQVLLISRIPRPSRRRNIVKVEHPSFSARTVKLGASECL